MGRPENLCSSSSPQTSDAVGGEKPLEPLLESNLVAPASTDEDALKSAEQSRAEESITPAEAGDGRAYAALDFGCAVLRDRLVTFDADEGDVLGESGSAVRR